MMFSRDEVAAVVLLYEPDDAVWHNIQSYLSLVKVLYVVINSELSQQFIHKLTEVEKVHLIKSDENIGIAKALNVVLTIAKEAGFSWIMTFDQDTFFFPRALEKFFSDINKFSKSNVKLFSPLHNKKLSDLSSLSPFTEKEVVMTSGNVVNIDAALLTGGYDEKLFIDEVDHAFCFQLQSYGYAIWQHNSIYVEHSLGEKINNRTVYPPERLYYMLRNYLYVKEKYGDDHTIFFKERDCYLRKFFLTQLLFGKEKYRNISMLFKGFIDYKKRHFGRLNA